MRFILIIAAMLLPITAQADDSYALIGGKEFTIPKPTGMCMLDGANPAEALMEDVIRSGNMGANDVVKIFADCKQLKALRDEERSDLTYYGSISVPQLPGKLNMDRKQYIAEARQALKMKEDLLGAAGINRAKAAVNDAASDNELSGLGLDSARFLGEVGASGETVQIGTVQKNRSMSGGEPKEVAGVATMSIIKGEQVVVNMHALYEGKKTITALRKYADAYYKKLIDANE